MGERKESELTRSRCPWHDKESAIHVVGKQHYASGGYQAHVECSGGCRGPLIIRNDIDEAMREAVAAWRYPLPIVMETGAAE